MRKLFLALILFISIAGAGAFALARSVPFASAATFSAKAVVSLSYLKSGYFSLSVRNVKKVQYALEYTRQTNSGDMLEGLQGSGKAVRGVYSRKIYAGTQSSKYFIPHKVKSGTITVTGTTTRGSTFSQTLSFVVKNGRLTITSRK